MLENIWRFWLFPALVLNEAKNGVVALSIRLRAHSPFGECNWRREHAGLCPKIRWYLIVAPESLQAPDMRGQNLSRPSSTISRVAEPILNPKCPKNRQDTVRTSKIGPLSLDCPSLINCLKDGQDVWPRIIQCRHSSQNSEIGTQSKAEKKEKEKYRSHGVQWVCTGYRVY